MGHFRKPRAGPGPRRPNPIPNKIFLDPDSKIQSTPKSQDA
jgi:hypothetical protein